MWIFREFNLEFIEVSHVEIEFKIHKLWSLEVQFWVPILTTIGITLAPTECNCSCVTAKEDSQMMAMTSVTAIESTNGDNQLPQSQWET